MTQDELNNKLDKSFTIPVDVRTNTFPNNQIYPELTNIAQNGFQFTGRELLHAIGSKTASLPSSNQDECVNAAYLYAHLLDFDSQYLGYKPIIQMDSDLQTNRSNEIGIGIGCLLANKIFDVEWDTLESIKGTGKRFDYRATQPGQHHVYEFKGTKHRGNQNEQIESGLSKKADMHQRQESYNIELISSVHVGLSNQQPRIVLADPPFEGFSGEFNEQAEYIYLFRHLSRLAQFIGNTPLSRHYYTLSSKFQKDMDFSQSHHLYENKLKRKTIVLEKQLSTIYAGNDSYIGRWVSYWKPERKYKNKKRVELPKFAESGNLEIFQGMNVELYYSMLENSPADLKIKSKYERKTQKSEDNIDYMTFRDGTAMAYRVINQ